MGMSRIRIAVLLLVSLADAQVVLAANQDDKKMNDLARSSGCYRCHRVEPPMPGGKEPLPSGPPWKEVARKYKTLPNATQRLTRIVLEGTGSYPGDRHWKGKATKLQMPPNAPPLSEADAKTLVCRILTLDN